MLRWVVVAALVLGPSLASAEDKAPLYGFVGKTRSDGKIFARQVLPPRSESPDAAPQDAIAASRTVFLNKGGVTLQPGNNDSRINRSTLVSAQTAIPAWNIGDSNWALVVGCMRDLFAAYDIAIVDTDPGNVPHIEAVFGGAPSLIGMDPNTLGVSPFTMDCSIIENSVVFVFTGGGYTFSPREACETMAQEVAHSFGLDHELLASDPMTYLDYSGARTFKDQMASCGEDSARVCGINGSVCRQQQNSVALLRERLGLADPIAPLLAFTSPPAYATVPPGFSVRATGTDNNAVTGATLKIDGVRSGELTGAGPYVFATPANLADGDHTIIVEISDGKNFKSETRTVTVMQGAPPLPGDGGEDLGNDVVGGCAAGGGHTGVLVGLLAFTVRRRRRQARRR